ncbi:MULTISPECIES: hypothetical protein [unclassified Anabaena]|uniref:hypothetical protein n=1 Tax=unclassified Anabaena TaxID=2619674 RepID=UPI000829B184|nr:MULTISPECIES: hypothetical protein [unclassified Anabaena]
MTLYRKKKPGYFAAVIGSFIGGIALLNLGEYLGNSYVKNFLPNAELDGIIPPVLGQFMGWWVGAVFGCWLALRWQNYRKSKKTASLLAIMTPGGIIIWTLLYLFFYQWGIANSSSAVLDQLQNYVKPISASLMMMVLAFVARHFTKPLPANQYQDD